MEVKEGFNWIVGFQLREGPYYRWSDVNEERLGS
jgi:hypothetical protein